jgi:hypothetical protein|tara:strand:+ start:2677 stop:3450 length:774 start_codon:yes stop_codon:yes gene_type:complete
MANKNGNGKLPSELSAAFEADAGLGLEDVTSSDMQIPFLRIIQALSPQVKKSDPAFIEGASQGDIFNTVTNKVWDADKGVSVLPVHFAQKMLEFVPRSAGGGFVGELSSDSDDVRRAVRDKDSGMEVLPNGNELVRTAQHYIKIVHEDGSLESAIVDMKKTQLKVSRKWITLIAMQKHNGSTLPSFANMYTLKSIEDGNDKGSWYSWSIGIGERVGSLEAYNDCKELHASIRSGELQIAPPVSERAIEDQSSDEVPF